MEICLQSTQWNGRCTVMVSRVYTGGVHFPLHHIWSCPPVYLPEPGICSTYSGCVSYFTESILQFEMLWGTDLYLKVSSV